MRWRNGELNLDGDPSLRLKSGHARDDANHFGIYKNMEKRRKTDRMPDEGSAQDVATYRRAWRSYVARRNLVVVLFLSFIFLGFMIGKLKLGEPADSAILVGWILVYLAGGWWLTEWKCPRCGKVFGHRLWTRSCISCDLSKDDVAAMARGKS
ncbi:MAG TPA: hypothetical protein VK706_04210 [Candidatus Sulfotelmatobacter sp.]|nr:hypothetical protein [Candidatus Sulfotelmatobacter sp.]